MKKYNFKEPYKNCGAKLLYKGDFVSNCIVFKHNNKVYSVTTGHSFFGEGFKDQKDIKFISVELESELVIEAKVLISDLDFAKKHELTLIELNYEKIELINEHLFSINYERIESKTLIGYHNDGFKMFTDIKFSTNTSESFFCSKIEKQKLIEHKTHSIGSGWLKGLSGSGLFFNNNSKIYCAGLLVEIPNNGEYEDLKFTNLQPLTEHLDNYVLHNPFDFKSKNDLELNSRPKLFEEFNDFIIDRTITNFKEKDLNSIDLFFDSSNKDEKTLAKVINEEDFVVLLASPGMGKTTELKKLYNSINENDSNEFIALFVDLKNFTTIHSIEQYLNYEYWKKYGSILYILDGLDEIKDKNDFILKFRVFKLYLDDKIQNFKFIISCRSSAYKSEFFIEAKVFYLDKISDTKAIDFLSTSLNKKFNEIEKSQLVKFSDFISNPYRLIMIKDWIESNEISTITLSGIWHNYISKRFRSDENTKEIIVPRIKNNSKKIAFVNELTMSNTITEDLLYEIVNGDIHGFKELKINPLFIFNENDNSFSFEQKNIQEYFVAILLKELDFEKIIHLISIPELEKVHPSLYNVCTFLLNLLETNTPLYQELIKWFIEHDKLLLFTADSNRILPFREQVFQDYFNKYCVEKTLWVGTGEIPISKEELGRFANSRKNLDFLISFIKNTKLNQRIRISAIELVGSFTDVLEIDVKELFFNLLKDKKVSYEIKREVIFAIEKLKLHLRNTNLIDEILTIFKSDSSSKINSAISCLFNEIDNLDPWFSYFKIEFERIIGIRKRKNKEKLNYFNGTIGIYKLQKFSDANFSKLSILILNTGYSHFSEYESSYWKKLAIEVLKRNSRFLKMLVNLLSKKDFQFHANREIIIEIIIEANCQIEAFKQILGFDDFTENKWNLAAIFNSECLKLLLDKNNKKPFETHELDQFRFILSYRGKRDLALLLQDNLIEKGFEITNLVQDEKQIEQYKKNELDRLQKEMKFVFDKDVLFDFIQNYVSEKKIENLSWEVIHNLETEFHKDDFTWSKPIPIELKYLKFINIEHGNIHFIENYIKDDYPRLKFLYGYLKDKNENIDFSKLSDEQLESMKYSFINFQKTINIKDISIHKDYNSYSFKSHKNYLESEKLKTFFQYYRFKEFQLTFEDDFLAECIEYYPLFNERYDREELEVFCERIKNKSILKKQIFKNLKQDMVSMTFKPQSRIALKYNYKECYPSIKKFLKEYEHIDSNDELLIDYLNKSNDKSILKYRTEKMNSYSSWYILEILLDKYQDSDYVLHKSKEYLKNNETQFDEFAYMFLFKLNDESAIDLFISRNGTLSSNKIKDKYFQNYSHFKIEHIEAFFNLTHSIEDSFYKHSMFFILNIMIEKNSKTIDNAEKLQSKLNIIKNKLSIKEKDYDSKLFYINKSIEHSRQALINQLSKPLAFKEAIKRTKELLTF